MTITEQYSTNIWHPCSQMKDYESFSALKIDNAKGSYFYLDNGQKVIDATSSWWCKNLGHGHPRLREALIKQSEKLEHVILANSTNDAIEDLSEKLTQLSPNLNKVMYASDGSCAVEMALKMSVHAQFLQGHKQRTKFMALSNSYHGETCLALSISDLGLYAKPYKDLYPQNYFLNDLPYINSSDDFAWHDCELYWPYIKYQLEKHATDLAAVIVEPILQSAGHMRFYSKELLKHLKNWCQKNNVYLISDEIVTAFGRIGKWLGCEYAGIEPDFICLAKGLTSGYLPLSAMLTTDAIYDLFYDDYETGKAFLHSHTYSGNALAAAVASETVNIIQDENLMTRANDLNQKMLTAMQNIAKRTGKLQNVRGIGAVVAADLISATPRAGYQLFQHAVKLGAWLRPLGNTIYWLPPLNISDECLAELAEITFESVGII